MDLAVHARRPGPSPWCCSAPSSLIEARLATTRSFRSGCSGSRALTGANLVMFCFGCAMFAMWFFLSLYLQQVLGYDPVITGLTFLPQTAAIAVGATIAGSPGPQARPPQRVDGRGPVARRGPVLAVVHPGRGHLLDRRLRWRVLATFGMGLAFTPIALSATGGVRPEEAGLASGLVNSSRQIGASLGWPSCRRWPPPTSSSLLAGRTVTPSSNGWP